MLNNWHMNDQLDWDECERMAKTLPYSEHTVLRTLKEVMKDGYKDIPFSESDKEEGLVLSSFHEKGRLKVIKTKELCNAAIFGSTGSSKTQGYILNNLFNINANYSMIILDQKTELFKLYGARAKELYGEKNVHVLNFLEPEHSVHINPLHLYGERWLAAEREKEKKSLRKKIISELRKYLETIFVIPENTKDDSWYDTARIFIFAIILGLLEDTTLTESMERKTNRKKVNPEQINWANVITIYQSFSWNEGYRQKNLNDNGFFTSRDKKKSFAYLQAKSILQNAQNTVANYMGFVELFLRNVIDPKIQQVSMVNDFDILTLGESPKVLFVTIDSDKLIREYANVVIAHLANELLEYSHKTGESLKTKVLFLMDEFPTLRPNAVYHSILAVGRSSGIFMHICCQSITQLKVRYPGEWQSMVENCDVTVFVGTNDAETARFFARELGQTTVPNPVAFLQNSFSCMTVPVVSEDQLLHKMQTGSVYIKLHHENPIFGSFELYYKTEEYAKYPKLSMQDYTACKLDMDSLVYDAPWMYTHDEDDDDDRF